MHFEMTQQVIRKLARKGHVRVTLHALAEMADESFLIDDNRKEPTMKCSITGCPGEYENRAIIHTIKHSGEVQVIEGVPAEVCSVCGDVLLSPDTVRHIETLLRNNPVPKRSAPVFDYA